MLKSIGRRIVTEYQRHEPWFAVGTVLLLGMLAYVPLMHKFGFYRDDWYMLWVGRAFGPQGIIDLFAFDRPFVGYIYSFSYQLLGENPILWQVYSFSLRVIGALGFLWLLRRLWPEHKIETTTAAILLFIYPGFLQWPNANTKSNHLTTHTLAILSICLTRPLRRFLAPNQNKGGAIISNEHLWTSSGRIGIVLPGLQIKSPERVPNQSINLSGCLS